MKQFSSAVQYTKKCQRSHLKHLQQQLLQQLQIRNYSAKRTTHQKLRPLFKRQENRASQFVYICW